MTAPGDQHASVKDLGRFWTIPNVLSLTRLVLVIPVFWLIVTEGSITAILILLAIGIATDWFDGRVARWSNSVSEWGKVLDPVADKVAAAALVLALVIGRVLPLWFLLVLLVRDVLIVLGGIYLAPRVKSVLPSLWMGKVAITAVALTIIAGVLGADQDVLQWCLWITTALLIWSFFEYALRFVRKLRSASPVPARHDEHGRTAPARKDSRAEAH